MIWSLYKPAQQLFTSLKDKQTENYISGMFR